MLLPIDVLLSFYKLSPIDIELELPPCDIDIELQPLGNDLELLPIDFDIPPIDIECAAIDMLLPIDILLSFSKLSPIDIELELPPCEIDIELQPIDDDLELSPIDFDFGLPPIDIECVWPSTCCRPSTLYCPSTSPRVNSSCHPVTSTSSSGPSTTT